MSLQMEDGSSVVTTRTCDDVHPCFLQAPSQLACRGHQDERLGHHIGALTTVRQGLTTQVVLHTHNKQKDAHVVTG